MSAQVSPVTERDWCVLLERYVDGMHNPDSRYAAAARIFKAQVANAVWDAVNANRAAQTVAA